jgi:hypothetical protein
VGSRVGESVTKRNTQQAGSDGYDDCDGDEGKYSFRGNEMVKE